MLHADRVSVLLLHDDGTRYAAYPRDGFHLNDDSPETRRAFFHLLARFRSGGSFFIPHERVAALRAVSPYDPRGNVLVFPLVAAHENVGAIVADVARHVSRDAVAAVTEYARLAAWVLYRERAHTPIEREDRQSALLASISERTRRELDRFATLQGVVEDVRDAFEADRCAIFVRAEPDRDTAKCLAVAESDEEMQHIPESMHIRGTWFERALEGAIIRRDSLGSEPEDASLTALGARAALLIPYMVDGKVEGVLALHFFQPRDFDEVDMVMLRSAGFHLGLSISNARLYEAERLRRARAESVERVVRVLRDTQSIGEVISVFTASAARETESLVAIYSYDAGTLTRRSVRAPEHFRFVPAERLDAADLVDSHDDLVASRTLRAELRKQLFGPMCGAVLPVRLDGRYWGFVAFADAAPDSHWEDAKRRSCLRSLTVHFELALATAYSFGRVHELARAVRESSEFKDDLIAMMAHDFKGPLTVINGYCELLLETGPDSIHGEVSTILTQAQRLGKLAEDALNLAHAQAAGFSLSRRPIDFREFLQNSIAGILRDNPRLHLELPGDAVPVLVDVERFRYVVENLVMNALKYSEANVIVRLTTEGSNARLDMIDRGIGIPEGELDSIFGRFGRGSNARNKGIAGTGIGLYVVRQITEAHGGTIAVASVEGVGSTFTVRLRLMEKPRH
ncbi:MAG: GAF domain-containing sensor histidine kinase [Candidatus Eremiobacteraeota bacterium]|nr:GAF domain-containing sensor histidine kinase [Candidatus Eremiobacteraeota bacterium]